MKQELDLKIEEEEIWGDVPSYPEYKASNLGRIFRKDRYRVGKGKFFQKGHFMKPRKDYQGYYRIDSISNSKRKVIKVHRMVAEAFLPNPENKKTVNHKDGDKSNNRLDNLEWMTHLENTNHAFYTGLRRPSINSKKAILSDNQIVEIREKYATGKYSQKELYKEYGVTQSYMSEILSGRKRNFILHLNSFYKENKI